MKVYKDETIVHNIILPVAESILDNVEMTFGQLNYWDKISAGLLVMDNVYQISLFNNVEEFLINMDFNHKQFVEHLQKKIVQRVKGEHQVYSIARQNFEEIIVRQDVRYTLTHQSLLKTMRRWFSETIPLTAESSDSTSSLKIVPKTPLQRRRYNKVTIRLSVDQYGILLRAADQTKLLDAPSFTHICEIFASIIATSDRKEISPRSLRSNSYPAEASDKLVAIHSLEKMIRWIKEC